MNFTSLTGLQTSKRLVALQEMTQSRPRIRCSIKVAYTEEADQPRDRKRPSPLRKVLKNSVDETSFLDQTISRSGSFLDRLISEMKSARKSKPDDLDFDQEFDGIRTIFRG